jgi:hypothetical protein
MQVLKCLLAKASAVALLLNGIEILNQIGADKTVGICGNPRICYESSSSLVYHLGSCRVSLWIRYGGYFGGGTEDSGPLGVEREHAWLGHVCRTLGDGSGITDWWMAYRGAWPEEDADLDWSALLGVGDLVGTGQ